MAYFPDDRSLYIISTLSNKNKWSYYFPENVHLTEYFTCYISETINNFLKHRSSRAVLYKFPFIYCYHGNF
jgi:hypothetical protein